jgi:uncharacterized protein (TIGR03435 family)
MAYRLRAYQISGPEWPASQRCGHRGQPGGRASPSQVPEMFQSFGEKLGLRLDPRKAPLEVVVVDSMLKTPNGN